MAFNILIVDDSRIVHAVIEKSLGMAQIATDEIYHAMNGKEGLELLSQKDIHLVISDIHMPEMDGVEMINTMWNDERLKQIPVVVISSEGGKKRIDEIKSRGVKGFIRKPFTPEMIQEMFEKVIHE